MTEITPEFIVEKLNEWFEKDPKALNSWAWEMFTKCNNAIANDEYVLIREFDPELGKKYSGTGLTPLGILNGILIAAGNKNVIAAKYTKFSSKETSLEGFVVVPQQKVL